MPTPHTHSVKIQKGVCSWGFDKGISPLQKKRNKRCLFLDFLNIFCIPCLFFPLNLQGKPEQKLLVLILGGWQKND
jgi:hypothetical protein